MQHNALGFIETFGLVSVLEAADAMCKAADVELIGYENVASGLISVIICGDVGAVQSAVEAGVARAQEVGDVYCHLVLPNPHPDIVKIARKYSFTL